MSVFKSEVGFSYALVETKYQSLNGDQLNHAVVMVKDVRSVPFHTRLG